MTNEEKLNKLLQIAVENGYDNWIFINAINNGVIEGLGLYAYNVRNSINDLILDWSKEEISFIEALSKESQKINGSIGLFPDSFKHQWIMKPTSQRLDYLFETFHRLL